MPLMELVIVGAIAFWLWWVSSKIIARIGLPTWYSTFLIVPGVQVVFVIWLAFREWPVEKEVKRLRLENAALRQPRVA